MPDNPADARGVSPVPGKWRAAALYTLLTLVLMYPLPVRIGHALPADDVDTQLGMWMIAWDVHAFTHHPLSIFDANAFYPHRRTLAYQDNLIGSALVAAPVMWLTGNPVAAINAVVILASILCALGGYVLARRVGLSEPAALLCGFIFSFCPARFFRTQQVGLAAVEWIPFTLASLHAYFDGGHKRDLRYALGFFTLQTLTSGHAALFLVVAIVTLLAYRFLLGEPIRPFRRIRDFGIPGALLLLPAVLVYLPYRMNQAQVGLRRGLGSWGTNPESFLASPTPLHFAIQTLFGWTFNERASGFLFPGYIPVLLSAIAVAFMIAAVARTKRPLASRAGLLAVARLALVTISGIGAFIALRRGATALVAHPSSGLWLACAAVAGGLIAMARVRQHGTTRADRRLVLLAAAVTGWVLLVAVQLALPAGDGLVARYYPNAQWIEPAAATPVDPTPSTSAIVRAWSGRPPEIFSARWSGFLTVPGDDRYRFTTTSDDGSRLFIDQHPVVDNGGAHSSATKTGTVYLTAGSHPVVLEYVQFGVQYELTWSWARGDADYRPVPAWVLSQRRTHYATAVAARLVDWGALLFAVGAAVGAALWLIIRFPTLWRSWGEQTAGVRRNPVALYLVFTVVCIGLAVGPPYSLWPYVYRWPGFSFIRAPLRFMVVGALGFAVLAGAGFDRIAAFLSSGHRRVVALATGALLFAEFSMIPIVTYPFEVKIPAADQWVARQPKPFVVAEVPLAAERYQTLYMLHSTAHFQKTVAGWGGIRPALSQQLNEELQTFPDETSIRHLAQLGVTYVIVHADLYPPGEWAPVDQRLRAYTGSSLRLEYADATSRVYSFGPAALTEAR